MFEMHAAELSKRIIVLQSHGNFQQQIAAALNGFVRGVVPWRIDVFGRAIGCEYPYEDRRSISARRQTRHRVANSLTKNSLPRT